MTTNLLGTFLTSAFILSMATQTATAQAAVAQKPLPQITSEDVSIHPYCSVEPEKKLDLKSKNIFDELRVTVTRGAQTRIRISGKKKEEVGFYEGRPVLHTGKLALVPIANRSGTVEVKFPTVIDVRNYYICVGYDGEKVKTKDLKLEKNVTYKWKIADENGDTVFRLTDPKGTEIEAIKAATGSVKFFGFGSTVRWKDNEADLAATFD